MKCIRLPFATLKLLMASFQGFLFTTVIRSTIGTNWISFREDYYAWEAIRRAWFAVGLFRFPADPQPAVQRCVYGIDGIWEYKGRQIIDRKFMILFGGSPSYLRDFMESYQRPYLLRSEGQNETVPVCAVRLAAVSQ